MTLAIGIIVYGFVASALPVWLLLAPRDYLSTFVKLGVVILLGFGILLIRPQLELPALTRFVDGTGPIFAGKIFPFCFITIACGAISGFHALISSGTTPKLSPAKRVRGQSATAPWRSKAMSASWRSSPRARCSPACSSPSTRRPARRRDPAGGRGDHLRLGFPVTVAEMDTLAGQVGEQTLMARTGGAPSLALGMAHIFSQIGGVDRFIGFWYHFAIMFEALFILTILDAGTRVGRFMLQDLLGSVYKPLGRTGWMPGVIGTSAAIVLAWGYFLIQGVRDPLGGINSLWPLFGIANQLLAAVALSVATTVLIKMHRWKYIWVTALPMVWLVTVTYTASYFKIFSPDPYLGFLAQANQLQAALAAGTVPAARIAATRAQIFNNQLDAVVCGIFVILVTLILADSLRIWTKILFGGAGARVGEAPFVLTQLRPEEI